MIVNSSYRFAVWHKKAAQTHAAMADELSTLADALDILPYKPTDDEIFKALLAAAAAAAKSAAHRKAAASEFRRYVSASRRLHGELFSDLRDAPLLPVAEAPDCEHLYYAPAPAKGASKHWAASMDSFNAVTHKANGSVVIARPGTPQDQKQKRIAIFLGGNVNVALYVYRKTVGWDEHGRPYVLLPPSDDESCGCTSHHLHLQAASTDSGSSSGSGSGSSSSSSSVKQLVVYACYVPNCDFVTEESRVRVNKWETMAADDLLLEARRESNRRAVPLDEFIASTAAAAAEDEDEEYSHASKRPRISSAAP